MSDIPASVLLSGWLAACLDGAAPPEAIRHARASSQDLHLVVGLAADPLSPLLAIGVLRSAGGRSASLALPVPGDLAGLAGPPAFNNEALETGEAVLVTGSGLGLVPEQGVEVVTWHAHPAERPRPLDPVQASSDLRQALALATRALVDLDVAHWQPEIVDVLANHGRRPPLHLPPGLAPREVETVERALLCREIVALARESDGGAVTAYEVQARRDALDPLDRVARAALVAVLSG